MILLAVAGVLSVGEGSRIYLKAILAQILLQNAWSQTQNGQGQVKPWRGRTPIPSHGLRSRRLMPT